MVHRMETCNQLLMVIDLTYITEESVEVTKPSIRAVAKTKQLTRRKLAQ